MQPKLKSFLRSEQTFYAALICMVGMIAFMLGRYSVLQPEIDLSSANNSAGVVFVDTPDAVVETGVTRVVASKSGAKYHLLTCSGASSIKEENKIYFNSIDQAKAAGYTPAANCKGLQ